MTSTFRRSAPVALIAALLAGCAEREPGAGPPPSSATPAVSSAAEPQISPEQVRALVRKADEAPPYAAEMMTTTEAQGVTGVRITGTVNLNSTPFTGRLRTERIVPSEEPEVSEIVVGDDAAWIREGGNGAWTEIDPGDVVQEAQVVNYGAYVLALLDTGEDVVEGPEPSPHGVQATRLSGRLEAEQVRFDSPVYDTLRAHDVDAFDCDVWLDDDGRVVAFEQWFTVGGVPVHNTVAFERFTEPVAFTRPRR